MATFPSIGTALFLLLVPQVSASGTFELRIEQFENSGALLAAGNRCVPECRTFFRVCLKHFQKVVSPEPCTYGNVLTPLLGTNSFTVPDNQAPLRINFTFKWPGTFSLIIEAWNSASNLPSLNVTSPETLISRFAIQRHQPVGTAWAQDSLQGEHTQLYYSYRVVCSQHYYGEGCSDYCRPRNDTFGHYTCGKEGQRLCLPGWQNEYCSQSICQAGCSLDHGYCDQPGECKCHYGWQGRLCDQCMHYPGCLHGTCQQPFQCTCKEGWGGLFCNQDLNYCTHNRPCLNNATCTNTGQGSYTCTCQPGFTGTNCESALRQCDSSPCRNGGTCTELDDSYMCSCLPGFYGQHCEDSTLTCAESPCFNGGSCIERSQGPPYSCICPLAFTGLNCEQKVDWCTRNLCANGGQCFDLGFSRMCRCQAGFAGQRCEINVNDCARSPCANGATCVDQINNYTCLCATGFSGRDCDQPLGSECDSMPCHNGGTCHAGVYGQTFVCQCPINFMGSLCEIPVFSVPLQKQQQPPSPFPWVAVSLAFGLMAFVMLLCVLAIALRHVQRPGGGQRHDTETMNNLTESQRDNLIVESQLKLTNKKVDLDSDCIVEKTNYKDRNFALDWNLAAGLKPDLTQDLKCHKNHRKEESLPLRNPCHQQPECRISTVSSARGLMYQPVYRTSEGRMHDIITEV
ncbi:delta-like protein 4 [Chiloscyllium punctatum]|uniref:delta-like protein 4 n=1 Tax=Chiloscyllium punctatum TaxID=137246 RepID=UPI003B63CD2A